ncbi:MAG: hypothetical protein IJC78_02415, partial [Clostridia bacterium]|nr:hypothetical protein [Clostridia bacterium]
MCDEFLFKNLPCVLNESHHSLYSIYSFGFHSSNLHDFSSALKGVAADAHTTQGKGKVMMTSQKSCSKYLLQLSCCVTTTTSNAGG